MDDQASWTGECEFDRRSDRGRHHRDSFDARALRWLHHLQSGCARCREALVRDGAEARVPDFERLAELFRSLSIEAGQTSDCRLPDRRAAARFVSRLESLPASHQALVIANCPASSRDAVCRQLVERARRTRFDLPTMTLRWAELAVLAARGISGPGRETVEVEAVAELGNARRLANDYAGSEAAFDEATQLLHRTGTGNGFALELRGLRVALDIERRDLTRAERELHRLWRDCKVLDAERETIFTEMRLGLVYTLMNDPDRAFAYDCRVLEAAEKTGDRWLKLLAINNLIRDALDAEDPVVGDWLASAQPLFEETSNENMLLKLDWSFGSWQVLRGAYDKGLRILSRVGERFHDLGLNADFARISLEMSGLQLILGRTIDSRKSATRALEVFDELDLRNERRHALAYLNGSSTVRLNRRWT